MNEKYKQWAVQAALMVALAVVLALVNRWLGVRVDVPPVPPVPPITVVVEPAPGTDSPPKVTVHRDLSK